MTTTYQPASADHRIGPALAEIALTAGRAILEIQKGGVDIIRKADDSPVTMADRRAEEIILAGLSELAPEIPVVAEEAVAAGHIPAVGARFFLVDPLDGTREFIGGRGEFTVNIALIEAGRPVAGVVYAPATGLMAVADADGARETVATPDGPLAPAEWRPLATRQVPATGPVAVASRSHRDAETDAFLAARGIEGVRSAGSSVKFCLVARGEADVYPRFGRTMQWDTAAGHAVLAAAGGCVLGTDGADLRYGEGPGGWENQAFIAWGRRPGAAS